MAETVMYFGENSPEYVAYRLLWDVANAENKDLRRRSTFTRRRASMDGADRKWILDTYAECLRGERRTHIRPKRQSIEHRLKRVTLKQVVG